MPAGRRRYNRKRDLTNLIHLEEAPIQNSNSFATLAAFGVIDFVQPKNNKIRALFA
jgi:hypothetical protein